MALPEIPISIILNQDNAVCNNIRAGLKNDEYAYCLKFRQLLFELKDILETSIYRIFSNVQKFLIENNFDQNSVRYFCHNNFNCRRPDLIPRRYNFADWDTNVRTLILYYCPSINRYTDDRAIDVCALLDVIKNFFGLQEYFSYADAVYKKRNTCYAHLTESGINVDDFVSAYAAYSSLVLKLKNVRRFTVRQNRQGWLRTIDN